MKPHNGRSAVGLFTKETSSRTGFSSLASHWFFRMSAVIISIQSGNRTNPNLKLKWYHMPLLFACTLNSKQQKLQIAKR